MLRSMYSGISGMKANQTKLDVIGNNISNVGTTAFKASTAKFKDMLSQNINGATAPTSSQGGRNASQVGLGVQLSSIDTIMTQGNLQTTNRSLDVAIDDGCGNQFLMVSKGPEIHKDTTLEVSHKAGSHGISDQSLSSSGSEIMYTRDGSFILDRDGNLLTSDGYRVLGYSLTNDDNTQLPTGSSSATVSAAGMDFRFGPGSQLNGYKVVLGNIGKGTATDATIDKAEKKIIIHGDFSSESSLKAEQLTAAINKQLSAAGISQRVDVSGDVPRYEGLATESISGGSNATAPNSISIMGVPFKFSEGSELNDYTIQIGKINDSRTTAKVDKNEKTITINGNFVEAGATTADNLQDAVNAALRSEGIKQTVKCTGIVSKISGLSATANTSGTNYAKPKDATGANNFKVTFSEVTGGEKGAVLNGYSISFAVDSTVTDADNFTVSVNKQSKTIQIKAKDDTIDTVKLAQVINDKLGEDITSHVKIDTITIPQDGSVTPPKLTNSSVKVADGVNLSAPDTVSVGGIGLSFPKGTIYNGVEVQIVDIDSKTIGAEIETTGTKPNVKVSKIKISGNFKEQDVDIDVLQQAINDKIKDKAADLGLTLSSGELTDADKINLSGSAKAISGLSSSAIMGGQDNATPVAAGSVLGMSFKFSEGSALNGYTIKVGNISAGTQTSADVDTTGKTITINGDFVTAGRVTLNGVKSAINLALQNKGIDQTVKEVTGNITQMNNVESISTTGGTPIQSINEDGTISYVNGALDVRAYDGNLKTLKIPDSVVDPATGETLKVQSFTIEKSGVIKCKLEGGATAAVGQIALASFKNAEGLTKNGNNLYSQSANSGAAIIKAGIGTAGDDNSGAFGNIEQSKLEVSNVDLAEQFTEMITTTRSFQASSKMINTGDEILQDIINLKR